MSERLIDFLLPLSRRERGLIAALVFGILPLAVAFLVLLPLAERVPAARQAETDARTLYQWVQARVAEKQALPAPSEAGSGMPIGSGGLEQSLIAVGLRPAVASLDVRDSGVIDLRFDAVRFVALADWLSASEPRWGYVLTRFRFDHLPETPGKVAAQLELTPKG